MTHKKKKEPKDAPSGQATLRDTFAAAVVASLCHGTLDDEGQAADVARRAYALADAMLVAREKEPEPPSPTEPTPEA